ncbi:MAG: helix-turn-helix domain-containing protein [Janthinobacterium lividum]
MASIDQLKELGRLIREKRGRMSAAELGQKIGRSQSYVSALENATIAQGQAKPITPPDEMLEAIADALKVPVSSLHRALGRVEIEREPFLDQIREAGVIEDLPEETQEEILEFMRFKVEQARRQREKK